MKSSAAVALVLAVAFVIRSAAFDAISRLNSETPLTTARIEGDERPTPSALDREIASWTARTIARPDDPEAWVRLGDSLMQRSREQVLPAFHKRAEAAYREAARLDPKHPQALVGLAWVANTRHQFEDGRNWARQALALNAQLPEAHALLGDAAMETGNYDEAFEHYQSALDIRPNLTSYSRASHLLWLTGDSRRAKALMHKAILAGAPHAENTAWCRAQLALMMFHEGALIPAAQLLDRALKEAPRNADVLAAMGRIKAAKKEYPGALELYERALSIVPKHPTLVALVDLYTLLDEPEEAALMSRRVLEFHEKQISEPSPSSNSPPTQAHGHTHTGNAELAYFLADTGQDLDRALEEAERAYKAYPNVHVADTLAWCYHKKGLHREAARTIRRALRWKTPDALILYHAGMIFSRTEDRVSAQKYLYQALNLNPNFHVHHAEAAAQTLRQLALRNAVDRSPTSIQTPPPVEPTGP